MKRRIILEPLTEQRSAVLQSPTAAVTETVELIINRSFVPTRRPSVPELELHSPHHTCRHDRYLSYSSSICIILLNTSQLNILIDNLHSSSAVALEIICFEPAQNWSTKMTGKHLGKRPLGRQGKRW